MTHRFFTTIFTCLLLLTVPSCSMLQDVATDVAAEAVGLGGDDQGMEIELDAQIGDRKNDVDTQVGGVKGTGEVKADRGAKVQVLTKQAESTVERAETVTVNNNKQQNVPPWILIALVLGWILPDPTAMYRSITSRFKKDAREQPIP